MKKKQSFDAVVFDMDGVIFDSETMVMYCWGLVADKYNIPDIRQACTECLGINRQDAKDKFLSRYGADFPYDRYKAEMSALFHERCSGGKLALKPGIQELLTALKESHILTAVATSTRAEVSVRELRDGGLLPYFDRVITGDTITRGKPHPDIYLTACRALNVDPARAYAIEDSYNGIRSAHAAGMMPIMVPDKLPPTEEMEQLSTVILPDLVEVRNFLFEE